MVVFIWAIAQGGTLQMKPWMTLQTELHFQQLLRDDTGQVKMIIIKVFNIYTCLKLNIE